MDSNSFDQSGHALLGTQWRKQVNGRTSLIIFFIYFIIIMINYLSFIIACTLVKSNIWDNVFDNN